MLFELFVIGSLWFWLLAAAWVVWMIWCIDHEEAFGATALVFGFTALLVLMGDFRPWTYFVSHPYVVLGGIGGYFVIGTIWAMIKWYFHLLNVRDSWIAAREMIAKRLNISLSRMDGLSDQDRSRIADYYRNNMYEFRQMKVEVSFRDNGTVSPPQATDNKARIVTWMTYWPFSAAWTLLNDPVRRIFNMIYQHISGMLQGMSNRVFKGL